MLDILTRSGKPVVRRLGKEKEKKTFSLHASFEHLF